jgi:glycosyltransferase involved in cell wall biosynthesis
MTDVQESGSGGIAIVHDYFTQRGGAEKVAGRLARLFPTARMHTSVFDPAVLPGPLTPTTVQASFLQRLLRTGMPLKAIAPLLPSAFGRLDLGGPSLVISSSSAFAHHVRPRDGAVHVCYCHTPPRFLWKSDEYFRSQNAQGRLLGPALAIYRRLDAAAAEHVDVYVANSKFTAERIRRAYGRPAQVIHPPVETTAFSPSTERTGRFLVVARLRPHKRIDLAIAAAERLGVPLDIIGEGPDLGRLQRLAGSQTRFLGWQTDEQVRWAMARCEGLIVPAAEDFGLTMAEVQAAGRPPIAFGDGGALEIVRDGVTGFHFAAQTREAIAEALLRAKHMPLDTDALVRSAQRFDGTVFDAAMRDLAEQALAGRRLAERQRHLRTAPACGVVGATPLGQAGAAPLASEAPVTLAASGTAWPASVGRVDPSEC